MCTALQTSCDTSDPRATTALAAEGYDVHNLSASLVQFSPRGTTLCTAVAAEER